MAAKDIEALTLNGYQNLLSILDSVPGDKVAKQAATAIRSLGSDLLTVRSKLRVELGTVKHLRRQRDGARKAMGAAISIAPDVGGGCRKQLLLALERIEAMKEDMVKKDAEIARLSHEVIMLRPSFVNDPTR